MRAVRIHKFGGPDVLQLDDIPIPEAGGGKLLIRIAAAGVNPVDYKIRRGGYPRVDEKDLPITLGRDLAGRLETAGAGFDAGAEVYAHLDWADGSYADYAICAPSGIAAKPARLSMVEAAAVPLAATTAWQGLFDHGGLKAGQRVLIHGASGGVGAFAVQFARVAGAYVIGTASGEEIERVRRLGASEVIDYKTQRFEAVARDIDLVFDLIGHETLDRSFAVLKRGGTLISTVQQPDAAKAAQAGVAAGIFSATPNAAELTRIAQLIDAGEVQVTIAKVFGLDDAAAAHRCLEEGHPHGKLALRVD